MIEASEAGAAMLAGIRTPGPTSFGRKLVTVPRFCGQRFGVDLQYLGVKLLGFAGTDPFIN
jgi:hypothetical protein